MVANSDINILVVMTSWDSSFEQRFFGLVNILREKGYNVNFCALMQIMKENNEVHLPGLPEEKLEQESFKRMHLKPIRSLRQLYQQVLNSHLFIGGTGRGLHKITAIAAMTGIPHIVINDLGHYYPICYQYDFLILNGDIIKNNFVKNYQCREDNIYVVGDLRFDSVVLPLPKKELDEFYKKYALDRKKPLVVFCSGAIQRIDEWTAQLYKKIVRCVQKNDFNIMIRLHPNDFAGHKRKASYLKDISSRILYPDVPVVDSKDCISAMQLCACMIFVESSCCFESSVFNKHAIAVNYHEWYLTDKGRGQDIFPKKRFDGFGLKGCLKEEKAKELLASGLLRPRVGAYGSEGIRWEGYRWLGADCHLSELSEVLKLENLQCVDQSLRQEHVKDYWYKIDGNAAERAADCIEKFIHNPAIHKRMFQGRLIRVAKSLSFLFKRMIRKYLKKEIR